MKFHRCCLQISEPRVVFRPILGLNVCNFVRNIDKIKKRKLDERGGKNQQSHSKRNGGRIFAKTSTLEILTK